MLNLNNTLDGYLKNVEVIGNTIQDTNNLANIRSVGDKVEGQELYKIGLACYGDNILRPDFELGLWNVSNGTAQADSTAIRTKGFLRIRNQAHLVKRFDGKLGCQVILFDENFKYLGQQSYAGGNYVRYDNILPNAKYMKINFLNTTDLNLQCVLFDRVPSNINGVEFVEFQESELEILSPVQLEKVGDVADRIICKDGVWGIEKHIGHYTFVGNEITLSQGVMGSTNLLYWSNCNTVLKNKPDTRYLLCNVQKYGACGSVNKEGLHHIGFNTTGVNMLFDTDKDIPGANNYLKGNYIKYILAEPQFIPLPHDQQVKLRTFAGQTNIAFLTEIPGQIKAQVPKSLGATVNTHTEQIADLHNSLERVKKLEETTVSTVETGNSFTTVDATNNGYFEDVKLEGRTLVNICPKPGYAVGSGDFRNNVVISDNVVEITMQEGHYTGINFSNNIANIKPNTTYTVIVNVLENTMTGGYFALIETNNNTSFEGVGLPLGYKGIFTTKATTRKTFTLPRIQSMSTVTCKSGEKIKFSLMVLEGDHTNNPPEFFEGLMSVGQDVEEVSVDSASSGNLLDLSHIVVGKYIANNNKDVEQGNSFYCDKYVKVYPGVKYQLIASDNSKQIGRVSCYDKTGNYISTTEYATNTPIYFDSTVDTIRLSFFDRLHLKDMLYFGTNSNYIGQVIKHDKKPLLYYNPTTETWEKLVLREWDTIEKHSDGKYYYHKRSEEVVLNGSENWVFDSTAIHTAVDRYLIPFPKAQGLSRLFCDNFTILDTTNINVEGVLIGSDKSIYCNIAKSKLSTQDVAGFKAWLKANPTTVVYQLAQEEVYECTNIDLMTYSGETNYIINSGAISPKSLLKVHNNISNVVKILQEKVSLLENTFIAGLKSVLSGDMYSLATILYPEDFEQNDNIEQDIMVIPE